MGEIINISTCISEDYKVRELTDHMYQIIFGKTIDSIRDELGISRHVPVRDHFSEDALHLVGEAESNAVEMINLLSRLIRRKLNKYEIKLIVELVSDPLACVGDALVANGEFYLEEK